MGSIAILYASETGTAWAMALDLFEHMSNMEPRTEVALYSVSEFAPQLCVRHQLLIWIVATTGQGQPPTSLRTVWKVLLQRRLTQERPFLGNSIAVLGLGDSSYAHYNVVGKRLDARLQQLGAVCFFPLHLCDDSQPGGAGVQYSQWRLQILRARFGEHVTPRIGPHAPSPFKVEVLGEEDAHGEVQFESTRRVDVTNCVRLTASSHWNDVRKVTLNVRTQPGDVLWLWPTNENRSSGALDPICIDDGGGPRGMVHRRPLITVAEWMAKHGLKDEIWRVSGPGLRYWNGRAMRLSQWLTWVFDPWSVAIPYYGVRVAAHFTLHRSADMLERLQDLAKDPFGAAVRSYVVEEFRTIAEVFEDFSTKVDQIPPAILLSALPLLQPRPYSVSHCHSDGTSSILVSIKQTRTPTHRLYTGRFSSTLLQNARTLECDSRAGMLQCLQQWRGERGIFVTAGTGIGGVLSFFTKQDVPLDWILYHGCRDRSLDSLIESSSLECLRKVTWAESRVPGAPAKYVWHSLLHDSAEIWDIMWGSADKSSETRNGGGGFMVVVGSTATARDVDSALATIIKMHGKKTHDEAVSLVRQKQSQGRMLVDVWN